LNLLPHDGVDFDDVIVKAEVVEGSPDFATKWARLELEESQLDSDVFVGVDDSPGRFECRRG
jgi:hypothetical protein